MSSLLKLFNEKLKRMCSHEVPEFRAGDTLRVMHSVIRGKKERVQKTEGLCTDRTGKAGGEHPSFRLRRVKDDIGVEYVFPLYLPTIKSIEVLRRGKVRRARLNYLRDLRGKKARIKELLPKKKQS